MSIKQRLAKLENQSNEQPFAPPSVVEIFVTHEDGTRELKERRVNGIVVYPAPASEPFDRLNELIDIAHARKAAHEQP